MSLGVYCEYVQKADCVILKPQTIYWYLRLVSVINLRATGAMKCNLTVINDPILWLSFGYWFTLCTPVPKVLTHRGWSRMTAILQTNLVGAFSWEKMLHRSFFPKVQLTMSYHCFRWWLYFYASASRRRRHYVFGLSVRPSIGNLKYPLSNCTWVCWSIRFFIIWHL